MPPRKTTEKSSATVRRATATGGQHRIAVPSVLMRGGTSRGLFVRREDLPSDGSELDRALLSLMGSPDSLQMDGLGGGASSTSKVMIVSKTSEPGCDLEYLFVQVAVDEPVVDEGGNCGNLTAAVGPFAIEEGMVPAIEPATTLVLFNLNTHKRIRVVVPVRDGRPLETGDYKLAGVRGTGAEITTEYLNPGGSVFSKTLPTGNAIDTVATRQGAVEVSIVDVSTPCVFVRATDLNLDPQINPQVANATPALLSRLEDIRGCCARLLGLVSAAEMAAQESPAIPRLALVTRPEAYVTTGGERIDENNMDLRGWMMSMQRMHHAFAGTTLMCAGAAAKIPGTIPQQVARQLSSVNVRVGHPKGIAAVSVRTTGSGSYAEIESVGLSRTARRLMAGQAFYYR